MDIQDIIDLKKEIAKNEKLLALKEGEKIQLLKQLKESFGCSTIEEAEKKIEEIRMSTAKLEASIKENIQKVEEKYVNNDNI